MPEVNAAVGMADFAGEFVKLHYRPGQKFIQLIFRTPEGDCLSLSRNVKMARSLVPGQTYTVQGEIRMLGKKQYVHEPTVVQAKGASAAASRLPFVRAHARALAIVAIVVALAVAGTLVLTNKDTPPPVTAKATASLGQEEPGAGGEVRGESTAANTANEADTPASQPAGTTAAATTKPRTNTVALTQGNTTPEPVAQQPAAPPAPAQQQPDEQSETPTPSDTTSEEPAPTSQDPATTEPGTGETSPSEPIVPAETTAQL